MSLSIAAMLSAAFGLLNATQAAIIQEVIDAAAILWALTPLTSKLKRNWPEPKPGPTLEFDAKRECPSRVKRSLSC